MARTGIDIQILDAKFAVPPEVNQNTMIIVAGATAVTPAEGALGFSLNVAYRLTGVGDLTALGVTSANNPEVYRHVVDFYTGGGVNRSGTLLWVGGIAGDSSALWSGVATVANAPGTFNDFVRQTTVESFSYRPRQVLIAENALSATGAPGQFTAFAAADMATLFEEGYALVAVYGGNFIASSTGPTATITALPDLGSGTPGTVPLGGVLVVSDVQSTPACVGRFGGWLAKTAVGQSVGDPSLGEFATTMYLIDGTAGASGAAPTYVNTPCSRLSLDNVNMLGDKQYLFTRSRPPKDGMYMNDGATCNDPDNALSTLEAARTICAYADDLRLYFTNYINTQVPVIPSGKQGVPAQLDPSWVEIVLEGARSQVSRKYIDNGDISDDRMTLRAKNDDFLGTRTLEVTSSLLPAFTLRWVDGSVSYVKNL